LGDIPESATKTAIKDGFHAMSKEAASLGVQTITLPQFVDQMGFKPQDRTVQLGTGAQARDFPPRKETTGEPSVSAGGVRVRRAPSAPAPVTKP
jgi:hypothetical protein